MTHYIIMGVSGCGKSTIGRALSEKLGLPFIEGDDYHPKSNVDKLRIGQPLCNDDRKDWIAALCQAMIDTGRSVTACSALNATVREWLRSGLDRPPVFIFLQGSKTLITQRLATRSDHFFNPTLLDSQFTALEVPEDALHISIDNPIEVIINDILRALVKN